MQLTARILDPLKGGYLLLINENNGQKLIGRIKGVEVEYECNIRLKLSWFAVNHGGFNTEYWVEQDGLELTIKTEFSFVEYTDAEKKAVGVWSLYTHQVANFIPYESAILDLSFLDDFDLMIQG